MVIEIPSKRGKSRGEMALQRDDGSINKLNGLNVLKKFVRIEG
jgi:hypothetical protein